MDAEWYQLICDRERNNSGTSPTRNKNFDRDGYIVVENLCDPEKLYRPVPEKRGVVIRYEKGQVDFEEEEVQVEGSSSCYKHPQYELIHTQIKYQLEELIGRELIETYYFDRFYFSGQSLKWHVDRDPCEISVSVHISSNLDEPWSFWIKTPDTYDGEEIVKKGEDRFCNLSPGDAVIYKGCERPHWREPMKDEEGLYYHQIFFHYVLKNGRRSSWGNK